MKLSYQFDCHFQLERLVCIAILLIFYNFETWTKTIESEFLKP